MKRKVFYTVILFCSLFMGQTLAANDIYLPTVAYRSNGQQKTVYEYNSDGYMTSGKLYFKFDESDEYTLQQSVVYDYHKFSNGEIVRTKTESDWDSYRTSSAYDANGMQLYEQGEMREGNSWILQNRTEAVLNGNGVRTGIREYNPATGQYETVPNYTFDDRGRQIRYEGFTGEYNDVPYIYTITWGSGRLYTGYSMQAGTESMVYQNIVPVLNEQYFNPYDLFGRSRDEASAAGVPPVILEPSYMDYEMHRPFYTGEMVYMGMTYTQQIVQDNANSEISEVVKLGNTEIQKRVYKQLANGGWAETSYENGVIVQEMTKEYDSHGFMTRDYYMEKEDGNITYQRETTCAVEYDTQGRPTKATKTSVYGDDEPYIEEETYEAWTVLGTTGISVITTDDPIVSTQYYDLTGKAVKQLQSGNIYIAKDLHRSGKASSRKFIEK